MQSSDKEKVVKVAQSNEKSADQRKPKRRSSRRRRSAKSGQPTESSAAKPAANPQPKPAARSDRQSRSPRRRRPQPKASITEMFAKGKQLSLTFFDEGRHGQVRMVARVGKTPVYPGSLGFEPKSGQPYDCSVLYYSEGRFGKAIPAVPSHYLNNGWLTPEALTQKQRQQLEFRWEAKQGRQKFVSHFSGQVVFMDHRDAQGKTDGLYWVRLTEQGTSLLARHLRHEGSPNAVAAAATKPTALDQAIPTVKQRFATTAVQGQPRTEADVSWTTRLVNPYERLGVEPTATGEQIEQAFAAAKAQIDPETVLAKLGKAATLTIRLNAVEAMKALEECYRLVREKCESREKELRHISPQPTAAGRSAKAALKATRGQAAVRNRHERERNAFDLVAIFKAAVAEAYAKPYEKIDLPELREPKADAKAQPPKPKYTDQQLNAAVIKVQTKTKTTEVEPNADLFARFAASKNATLRDRQLAELAAAQGPATVILDGRLGCRQAARLNRFLVRSLAAQKRRSSKSTK
jgi:hypothetical protein